MSRFAKTKDKFFHFTVEALYEIVNSLLQEINENIPSYLSHQGCIDFKEKQLRNHRRIRLYLSELYLRHVWDGFEEFDTEPLSCSKCNTSFIKDDVLYQCHPDEVRCYPCIKHKKEITILTKEEIYQTHKNDKIQKQWDLFLSLKYKVKKDFANIKRAKRYVDSMMETDISKEITDKIEDILYKNGNMQLLKETLSSEHYKFIRGGYDLSKMEFEEQIDLMNHLALL